MLAKASLAAITWLLLSSQLALGFQAGENSTFEVVESLPGRMTLTLRPFDIQYASKVVGQVVYDELSISGFGLTQVPGQPALPSISLLIDVSGIASVRWRITGSDSETIPDIMLQKLPIDERQTADVASGLGKVPSQSVIEIADTSRWRGRTIARLVVHPIKYNEVSRSLHILRNLKFELLYDGLHIATPSNRYRADLVSSLSSSMSRNFLVLSPERGQSPVKADAARQAGWYDPNADYYKVAVERDGVYAIRYDDLVAQGVIPETFDLNTLKLINRGTPVPIWISGPTQPALGRENVIYFVGARHRGSSGFYDVYTDTNIYWLTDSGLEGLRYRAGPDSLDGTTRADFFWETLHLEEENIFHRSNLSSAIDEDEGWIWKYLFAGQRHLVSFSLAGLSKVELPGNLRVRLRGTSLDPVSNDHHVNILLNGRLIQEVFFDDQEGLTVSAEVPTAWLLDEKNQLEIQLVPDTGAEINQIYVDWIEMEYPRFFNTDTDALHFNSPPNSTGPETFTLSGFNDDEILVFDEKRAMMMRTSVQKGSVYLVESAGFHDGKFVRFLVDGVPKLMRDRGHHLAVIDSESGNAQFRNFDTFASPEAADAMAALIDSLPAGTVVLAGISDDGSAGMTESAYLALESLGSAQTRSVGPSGSWSLIGIKGAEIGTVKEESITGGQGPAMTIDTLRGNKGFRYLASFSDSIAGTAYFATSASAALTPMGIMADRRSELRAVTQGADYLVITHKEFQQSARRLADYRSEVDGFRTAVIEIEDIYDEFSFGIVDPQAIKDFLNYAVGNWQPPAPSYVILIGDASWDPKMQAANSKKKNYIPSYGILVADNWFVTLDGEDDLLPDIAIGRIPAETPEQANGVVNKIIAYEKQPHAAWNKEFMFLNGGISTNEQAVFRAQATALKEDYLESRPLAARVNSFDKTTNELITQSFRRAAAERISEGVVWVNFLGHAGSAVWDIDIGLPDEWGNERVFPFVSGMSCHASRFANPEINSLAENFFMSSIGAIAYWGSTGFGYVVQDFFLLRGLLQAVSIDSVRRIGDATTFAKVYLWQQLGEQEKSRFVIDQYVLIGDPALKLKIPRTPELSVVSQDLSLESEFVLLGDSTFEVSARIRNFGLVPEDSVQVSFSLLNKEGSRLFYESSLRPPVALSDSAVAVIGLPPEPGSYNIEVQIDPDDLIREVDKSNNLAGKEVFVFQSDLAPIRPMNFGVVGESQVILVTANSREPGPDDQYYFELDTSIVFNSPILASSGGIHPGALVTSWTVRLSPQTPYYWRVRSFDGNHFGQWATSSFTYRPNLSLQWFQEGSAQFGNNTFEELSFTSNAARLATTTQVLRCESAGALDGNYSIIERNGQILDFNRRGHNVVVLSPGGSSIIGVKSFDTYKDPVFADSMSIYIDRLEQGVMALVAIKDDGSASMTESAYQALEALGSRYTRQVGFGDSWAIIGRKGALRGTVPEVWRPAGQGRVSIADSSNRFAQEGSMVSTEIGPALSWRSASFDYDLGDANNALRFDVLGLNRRTHVTDTVLSSTALAEVDLGNVDPVVYPKIKLAATFNSSEGISSPMLNSWSVDFVPPAELVLDKASVSIDKDTVQVGENVNLQVQTGNFGFADTDSFTVRVIASESGEEEVEVAHRRVPSLAVDAKSTHVLSFSSAPFNGRLELQVSVDASDEVVEFDESNNAVTLSLWVAQDTLQPDIDVTFDGRKIGVDDFVSSQPSVVVEIRDQGATPLEDTSSVTILLDGEKVTYGPAVGKAQFMPQGTAGNLKAQVLFSPTLASGEHEIQVLAKDESDNLSFFEAKFFVSDDFVLGNVMNYPNPFSHATAFTYVLTQPADQVRIKIYTIAGRLIKQIEPAPAQVGFNQVEWDGRDGTGDTLANGAYLYKIIARRGDQQHEVVEKFAIMR